MGRLTCTAQLFFYVMETALQVETAVSTNDRGRFIAILVLVLVSSAVVNMASLLWIHKVMDFTGKTTGRALCIVLHLLQLGILWRYFKLIVLADGRDEKEYHTLRLCQVVLQNAPFLVIQGYLLLSGQDSADGVLSIVIAILSLTYAISCYESTSSNETFESETISKTSPTFLIRTGIQFLCHLFILTSRFLAAALFTTKVKLWILLLFGGHLIVYICVRCIVSFFSKNKKLKQTVPLFGLESFVHVWDNLNLTMESNIYGMSLLYLVFLMENAAMTLVWFIGRESSSRNVILVVLVFASFLLGGMLAVLVRQLVKNHCLCTNTSRMKRHQKGKLSPRNPTHKSASCTAPDEELVVGEVWSDKHCFINSVFDLDFDPVPLTPTSYISAQDAEKGGCISSVSALCVDVKPVSTLDESTSGRGSISMDEHISPDSGFISLTLPAATDHDYASSVSRNTNTLDVSISSTAREASSEASSSQLIRSTPKCKHHTGERSKVDTLPKIHSVNRTSARTRGMNQKPVSSVNQVCALDKTVGQDMAQPSAVTRGGSLSSEFTSETEFSPVESGIHSNENLQFHSHPNARRTCAQHRSVGVGGKFGWVCDDVTCTSDSTSDSYTYAHRRHHRREGWKYVWDDSGSDSSSESFCHTCDVSSSSSSSTNTFDMSDSDLGCSMTWPPRKRITIVNLGSLPKEQVSVHDNVCSWLSQMENLSRSPVQGRRALREARMRQATQNATGHGLVTQNCYRRACSLRAKRSNTKRHTTNTDVTKVTHLAQKKRKRRHLLLNLCSKRTKKSTGLVKMLQRDKREGLADKLVHDEELGVVHTLPLGNESSV